MTGRIISIRSTIFPERGLRIARSFWLLPLILPLIGPVRMTAAVLLAAVAHECGHLALLYAFRVPPEGLRLSALGAELRVRTERLSYGRELLVTLAGPAVNLLSAPLWAALAGGGRREWCYLFAGAHCLLGLYNLLPVPPLDGGRALYLLTAWRFGPDAGERVSAGTGLCTAAALTICGLYVSVRYGGVLFLLAPLGLLFTALRARG